MGFRRDQRASASLHLGGAIRKSPESFAGHDVLHLENETRKTTDFRRICRKLEYAGPRSNPKRRLDLPGRSHQGIYVDLIKGNACTEEAREVSFCL
jgi:hypothetical protein